MINLLAIDLQQALAQAETWIAAFFAWLGSSTVAALIIGFVTKHLTRKVNNQTTVSKAQIEQAAEISAEKTARKIAGKSFNVNIKAEVSKAVKAELTPIRENAENASISARNAEIATAYILQAQSRSRLLTKDEQASLKEISAKILAHADGEVVAPCVIEVEEPIAKQEPTAKEETTENESIVSFADI